MDNRRALYRLVATSALRLYQFRPDVHLTGLGDRRRFSLEERIPDLRPKEDPFRPVALWSVERREVAPAAMRATWDLFPPLMDQWDARIQAGVVQEITRGPHVAVQEALYRETVDLLREAGIEVVIVQGVMHPAAADLYDTGIGDDFLEFARTLETDLGARFVARPEMARFAESDFYDLVHTNRRGASKITRAMLRKLDEAGIGSDRDAQTETGR